MKSSFLLFVSLILLAPTSLLQASGTGILSIFVWKGDEIVRFEQNVEFDEPIDYFSLALQAQLNGVPEIDDGWSFSPFLGEGAVLKSFEIVDRKAIIELDSPDLNERFLDEEVQEQFSWLLDEWVQYSPDIDSTEVWLSNGFGIDLFLSNKPQPLLFKPDVPDETSIGRRVASAHQMSAQGNAQPSGALSDASIFLSPGHGWHYNTTLKRWATQRSNSFQIIEDHSNGEAVLQYLHQYLWNAGARVYTARERDLNTNMVIVQNRGPGYSETGNWVTETVGGTYDGAHRRATTVVGEPTAVARFTPDIPEAGYYAVYVWYRAAAAAQATTGDARIEIHHTGDTTTWIQDQARDGYTWKYIGTYYFEKGIHPETGSVTITNQSSIAGRHVIADAVRFGGGMGDMPDNISGTISGKPRWEESGRYYAGFLGKNNWASSGTVDAMPRWAAWEHESWESGKSVYVAWHTNAAGGTGTETFAYSSAGRNGPFNGVPGGLELRNFIHDHVIRDARSLWKSNWTDRGKLTHWFGEINPTNNPVMPSALIEIAFHDREEDAKYLLDPQFRRDMARAVYKGLVQFYVNKLPGFDNATYLPEPPQNFHVEANSDGSIDLGWVPPVYGTGLNSLYGHAATGYRVYQSKNGYGFDNGTAVSDTSATLTGFAPGEIVFLRVTATNAGGESFPTSTLAVRIPDASEKKLLIVNGFTRNDRFMNTLEVDPHSPRPVSRGYVDRLNTGNYIIPHARAIEEYPEIVGFDSAEAAAVEAGTVFLTDYDAVIWMAGLQAQKNDIGTKQTPAFSLGLKNRIAQYQSGGGQLFVSGSEIAWDVARGEAPNWLSGVLRARYLQQLPAAGARGSSNSFLSNWSGQFGPGGAGYPLERPDVIEPIAGSQSVIAYLGSEVNVVEGFEAVAGWWQPGMSGSTTGAGSFSVVSNPVYHGIGAAKIDYDWSPGGFIRVHNPARTPFPSDSNLSIWVYGDNSGHRFRLSVQDSDNELFASSYVTIDFTGWREIVWEDIRNNATRWAGLGDGVVTGAMVGFESLQLQRSGNGPVSGTIYVDYAVATPVEVEGDERTAGIQYEGAHRLFYLAFPFEKIASENDRSDLMARVLDFFRFNRTPFENWQVEFFSANELDDPEVSGKLANPAGDGIPNLLKYALGLDPWVADRSGLPEVQIDAERLTLRYSRTKSATDLNYIVEVSEDLVTWENGEEEVEIVDVVDEGDTERVTVRDQKPFPESGRRFMRLRVVPID